MSGFSAMLGRLGDRGKFITFEGLDGSGKSTQLHLLADALRSRGLSVVITREPGGTLVGEKIRAMTLDSRTAGLLPRTELTLMFASRVQLLDEVILPALEKGSWVLGDRFSDSSEAYQGGGRQLGSELVLDIHRTVCQGVLPDLTILLDFEAGASEQRVYDRGLSSAQPGKQLGDRFEQESQKFFERVRRKYLEIAIREPLRVHSIDARLSVKMTHQHILDVICTRFPQRTGAAVAVRSEKVPTDIAF